MIDTLLTSTIWVLTATLSISAIVCVGIGLRAMSPKENNLIDNFISAGLGINHGSGSLTQKIKQFTEDNLKVSPRTFIGSNTLGMGPVNVGLANIQYLIENISARTEKQVCLVGVNRAGVMLASLLAQRLDLHERNVLKFDYSPLTADENCEDPKTNDDGPLIVIDDISRSGETLAYVRKTLKENNPAREVLVMTLIKMIRENHTENDNICDYSPWVTYDKKIDLPWTKSNKNSSSKTALGNFTALGINDRDLDKVLLDLK